ncbi:tripartite tricarboxylate transporter TctB family protein [Zobellella endophytica]|uniref:Tripartite tricarboxylate transporter TctB family protein n=1 Tax=Zobellella endophytica TaxID=2116700 RepID=A0A2P7QX91_9GAMM|nr:tripartite tricarboxylate transporter TctB family protein [Zobellella endophytica]PSJ42589.1 tripartite tricarboxylate transporter TctB family protein [Zobellella endophytica]
MADRLFSLALMVAAVALGAAAWRLEVPFQYEPVGPKAIPLILAALLFGTAAWLMIRPDRLKEAYGGGMFGRHLLVVLCLLAYAWSFEPLGFVLSTWLVGTVFARIFGLGWGRGALYSAALGLVGYVLLSLVLELNVPVGAVFGG